MRSPLVRLLLCLAVVLACVPPWLRARPSDEPSFVVPAAVTAPQAPPAFSSALVVPPGQIPSVHAPSVCETADGIVHVAWYGGTREGARDVAIYLAHRATAPKSGWSPARVVISRESAERDLRRPIGRLGNPVLFAGDAGALHLLYVAAVGGWATSSVNLTTSPDGGETWQPSVRLTLSPFFNVSELVRNPPTRMSDGRWAVPIYHECLGKFPEMLMLDLGLSLTWTKTRIAAAGGLLQPALVALDAQRGIAFCRDGSGRTGDGKIHVVRTQDAGRTWSAPVSTGLPNPDAAIAALRLTDGRLMLAFNDCPTGRDRLALAMSSDDGETWSQAIEVENEPGAEFSYPCLAQARDGHIHLVYTWKRQSIKHVSFTPAWLSLRLQTAGSSP